MESDAEFAMYFYSMVVVIIAFTFAPAIYHWKRLSKLSFTAKIVWGLHSFIATISFGFIAQAPRIEEYERDNTTKDGNGQQ